MNQLDYMDYNITSNSLIKEDKLENIEIEFNKIDEELWNRNLVKFVDSSIYQTWSYGIYNVGGANLDHAVIKKSGKIIAMVQIRNLTLPVWKRGIAYVYWGPIWQLNGEENNKIYLEKILSFLYDEYVVKRKLMLRIIPSIWEEEKGNYEEVFRNAGFQFNNERKKECTIIIDLKQSYDELRKNFRPNTRRDLQNSEKKSLEIISGTSEKLFEIFHDLYNELLRIKMIPIPTDINKYIKIQNRLPELLKMKIFICRYENRPVAGIVGTNIGQTGIILFSATNSEGRKLKATYLLQWEMIKWLKESGCRWYDLGGIDQESNPGCFRFKSGLGGRIINYAGQYESCRNKSSRIVTNYGEYFRKLKQIINHIYNNKD